MLQQEMTLLDTATIVANDVTAGNDFTNQEDNSLMLQQEMSFPILQQQH